MMIAAAHLRPDDIIDDTPSDLADVYDGEINGHVTVVTAMRSTRGSVPGMWRVTVRVPETGEHWYRIYTDTRLFPAFRP